MSLKNELSTKVIEIDNLFEILVRKLKIKNSKNRETYLKR